MNVFNPVWIPSQKWQLVKWLTERYPKDRWKFERTKKKQLYATYFNCREERSNTMIGYFGVCFGKMRAGFLHYIPIAMPIALLALFAWGAGVCVICYKEVRACRRNFEKVKADFWVHNFEKLEQISKRLAILAERR